MKARIEVSDYGLVLAANDLIARGHQAVKDLVAGGGHVESIRQVDRPVTVAHVDGPDELVRPVVNVLMELVHAG